MKWEKSIDGSAFSDLIENPRVSTIWDADGHHILDFDYRGIKIYGTSCEANPTVMRIGMYTTAYAYIQIPYNGALHIWAPGTATVGRFTYDHSYQHHNGSGTRIFQMYPYSTAGVALGGYGDREMMVSYDDFLRINQAASHANGIWFGVSTLLMYTGHLYLGSTGGAGQINIYGSSADSTERVTIKGADGTIRGNAIFAQFYSTGMWSTYFYNWSTPLYYYPDTSSVIATDGNGKITVKEAGTYLVSVMFTVALSALVNCDFYVNRYNSGGTAQKYHNYRIHNANATNARTYSGTICFIESCAVNDYFYTYFSTGTPNYANEWACFSITKLN